MRLSRPSLVIIPCLLAALSTCSCTRQPEPLHTRLTKAIDNGDVTAVDRLIASGADVNRNDESYDSPLSRALMSPNYNEQIVELLIQHGAKLDHLGADGKTPLTVSICNRRSESTKRLLAAGADPNAQFPKMNVEPPLMYALLDEAAIPFLLDAGADVRYTNSAGDTPLHWMAETKHADAAKQLIDRGADVHAKNKHRETPLVRALADARCLTVLFDAGATIEECGKSAVGVLRYAAIRGDADVLRILIDHGADVRSVDENGRTILMYVAEVSIHQHILDLLLEAGADVNAWGPNGDTPLKLAKMFSLRRYEDWLLDHGAVQ